MHDFENIILSHAKRIAEYSALRPKYFRYNHFSVICTKFNHYYYLFYITILLYTFLKGFSTKDDGDHVQLI